MNVQPIRQPLSVVIDTHVLIWALFERSLLSTAADFKLATAEVSGAPIYVPTISFVELRYLVEKGKFPERVYTECLNKVNDPTTALTPAPLDLITADTLSQIARATVPDMPDRIIAPTALALGLPLISADTDIRKLTNPTIIW